MGSIRDFSILITRPWSDLPMGRIDYILFAILNLAVWALLNIVAGPYGPARELMAQALVARYGLLAAAIEWTFLSASLNRAHDTGCPRLKFLCVYAPGRMLALYHMLVVPTPFMACVTLVAVAVPLGFLMICGPERWLSGLTWPTIDLIFNTIIAMLFFGRDHTGLGYRPHHEFLEHVAASDYERRQRALARMDPRDRLPWSPEDRPAHPGR